MLHEATTQASWAVAIKRTLETYGCDPAPIFAEAGIHLEDLTDPNARFLTHKTSALMRQAVAATADPAFGLAVGRHMRPTSAHAMGFSIWASNNLCEAIERVQKFFKIFTTSCYCSIEKRGDQYLISSHAYPAYQSVIGSEDQEAMFSTILQTFRHLVPGRLNVNRVGLSRPGPPANVADFERFFKCPIEWGYNGIYVLLDAEQVEAQLPTANAELALQNDKLCQDYIVRFDRQDIVNQVSNTLVELLPQGEPGMAEIASKLMMSSRTLQRKLNNHDTSFKQLLEAVRKQIAIQYIRQTHIPIGEISYRLGFAHINNFSRAFKRWTGITPINYRDNKH
ncbi:MAG: AraC-like DNA-binding protein [Motiliproteus sp.]|jgi:AraC-like DNA-binding protein